MSLVLKSEMFWRTDPAVQAACKLPAWPKFHRECGKQWLYFDHIERVGKAGSDYSAQAFTLTGRDRGTYSAVATGKGKTPIAALADAFRGAAVKGFDVPEAYHWMALLQNPDQAAPSAALGSEFDDILGGDVAVDDYSELLG